MVITYSAIFKKNKTDPEWWDVSIPDVREAVTCGNSLENARLMAKELLKTIYKLSPKQLGHPSFAKEGGNNSSEEMVEVIEVEVSDDFKYSNLPSSKRKNPIVFDFGPEKYKFYGSLFDARISRIFLLKNNESIKEEIIDLDKKYRILQIARSILWEELVG